MPRNARHALDIEYAGQGDVIPLGDGLRGYRAIQCLGERRIAFKARFKFGGLLGPV